MKDEAYFLNQALKQAQRAKAVGEVPIGAVVVLEGTIIGRGFNRKESRQQAMSHAECEAIASACRKLNSWRLLGAELYTTLEPCPMCAGLILQARVSKVVYGALDIKWGALGSKIDLRPVAFNHQVDWVYRPTEACAQILTDFFKEKRK